MVTVAVTGIMPSSGWERSFMSMHPFSRPPPSSVKSSYSRLWVDPMRLTPAAELLQIVDRPCMHVSRPNAFRSLLIRDQKVS